MNKEEVWHGPIDQMNDIRWFYLLSQLVPDREDTRASGVADPELSHLAPVLGWIYLLLKSEYKSLYDIKN